MCSWPLVYNLMNEKKETFSSILTTVCQLVNLFHDANSFVNILSTCCWTLKSFRRSLATVKEKLKSNGEHDIDVKELEPNGGAEAHSSIQVHKPLKHRTTSLFSIPTNANVYESTKHIHTRTQLQRVNGARGLCRRWIRHHRCWRW